MRKIGAALVIVIFLSTILTACQPAAKISLDDLPVPENGKADSTIAAMPAQDFLPWGISGSESTQTLTDGPYAGYTITGTTAYIYQTKDIQGTSSVNDFYTGKLTGLGWKVADQRIYTLGLGTFGDGLGFKKGSQVIYLVGYANPADSGQWISVVFILTKM